MDEQRLQFRFDHSLVDLLEQHFFLYKDQAALVLEFFEQLDEYFAFCVEDTLILQIDSYLILLDIFQINNRLACFYFLINNIIQIGNIFNFISYLHFEAVLNIAHSLNKGVLSAFLQLFDEFGSESSRVDDYLHFIVII